MVIRYKYGYVSLGIANAYLYKSQRELTKRAPDAGDSGHIPSSFHAVTFFWLDGFAAPAPAQVTQTVGRLARITFVLCAFVSFQG